MVQCIKLGLCTPAKLPKTSDRIPFFKLSFAPEVSRYSDLGGCVNTEASKSDGKGSSIPSDLTLSHCENV